MLTGLYIGTEMIRDVLLDATFTGSSLVPCTMPTARILKLFSTLGVHLPVTLCHHSNMLPCCSDLVHLHVTNKYVTIAERSPIVACHYGKVAAKTAQSSAPKKPATLALQSSAPKGSPKAWLSNNIVVGQCVDMPSVTKIMARRSHFGSSSPGLYNASERIYCTNSWFLQSILIEELSQPHILYFTIL